MNQTDVVVQHPDSASSKNGKCVKKTGQRKILSYVLRLAFSIFLIFMILRHVDIHKVLEYILRMKLSFFFFAYILVLAGSVPSAYAWRIILKAQNIEIPLWRVVHLNLVGFFFSAFLPVGVGGEIWRTYALAKYSEKTGESIASVIVERFTAVSSIILLGLVSFFFNIERFRQAGILLPVSIFFGVLSFGCMVIIFFLPFILKKGKGIVEKFIPNISDQGMTEAILIFKNKPMIVLSALFLNGLSPLFECVIYILIIRSLHLNVSILPIFMFVPIMRFINHIPVSISSIGTQDITVLLFWQPLGLNSAQALSVSFVMHILRIVVGITCGMLYVLIPYKNEK